MHVCLATICYCLHAQKGVAPIHSAVYLGLENMVELLINYGAQVNLRMKVRTEKVANS